MSFRDLKVDELTRVADYFVVDVEAAGDKATKKELIAALASGDEPVSWEQYETIYLPNQPEFAAAQAAEKKAVEEAEAEDAKTETVVSDADVDQSDWLVVKYERQNPRYDVAGLTFTKAHPYRTVHPDTAAYLIRECEGFSLALPSEVADYYN